VKQSLKQSQKLSLKLTANLGNQIKLLSLSGFEISSKLNELIEEYCDENDKKISIFKEEFLSDKYRNAIYKKEVEYKLPRTSFEESSLRDNLHDQLELEPLDQIQMLVGEFIIDSVEENGKLDPHFNYDDVRRIIHEDFGTYVSDQDINKVLRIIQNLEPPGCAYRNIKESLIAQINNLDANKSIKETLHNYLDKLIENELSIEDLPSNIRDNFSKLTLNPASGFGETSKIYIRPDLLAIQESETWHVSLNDEFLSKELMEYVTDKIDSTENKKKFEYKSFLKGLERRQQTLLLVAQYIIEAQTSFLNGIAGKKAISNEEIAEKLNINPSTVSRIVRNKFIQFPDRISALTNLLERRVNRRREGNDVTIDDLEYLINEIINEENKSHPLSDQDLTGVLREKLGIILSRRTVAKYRSNLNIPSSRERQIN
tara:strand:+ start:3351 stop:4637 length:1287 start_codon:yes stop_codon:yes gene_type:complete